MEVQEQTENSVETPEVQAEENRNHGRRGRAEREHVERETSSNVVTLGPRDQLVGRLTIEGDLRIQGTVEGEVHASGDVDVAERSTVRASIEGRNVSIRGDVNGDLVARERLTLAGSGTLNGNVRVARIAIEDGATLNGNVTMQRGE